MQKNVMENIIEESFPGNIMVIQMMFNVKRSIKIFKNVEMWFITNTSRKV